MKNFEEFLLYLIFFYIFHGEIKHERIIFISIFFSFIGSFRVLNGALKLVWFMFFKTVFYYKKQGKPEKKNVWFPIFIYLF